MGTTSVITDNILNTLAFPFVFPRSLETSAYLYVTTTRRLYNKQHAIA